MNILRGGVCITIKVSINEKTRRKEALAVGVASLSFTSQPPLLLHY